MFVKELAGSDNSAPVGVNVEPGIGEGGVETTKLVTVTGGSLTTLEGNRTGGLELVSGGWEGEEELGGLEGETAGGKDEGDRDEGGKDDGGEGRDEGGEGRDEGKDKGRDEGREEGKEEERPITNGLDVGEDTKLGERGKEVEDMGEEVEMVVSVGIDVGKIVPLVKEDGGKEEGGIELGVTVGDGRRTKDEEMLGEIEGTELELTTNEDSVIEGDLKGNIPESELDDGSTGLESEG